MYPKLEFSLEETRAFLLRVPQQLIFVAYFCVNVSDSVQNSLSFSLALPPTPPGILLSLYCCVSSPKIWEIHGIVFQTHLPASVLWLALVRTSSQVLHPSTWKSQAEDLFKWLPIALSLKSTNLNKGPLSLSISVSVSLSPQLRWPFFLFPERSHLLCPLRAFTHVPSSNRPPSHPLCPEILTPDIVLIFLLQVSIYLFACLLNICLPHSTVSSQRQGQVCFVLH